MCRVRRFEGLGRFRHLGGFGQFRREVRSLGLRILGLLVVSVHGLGFRVQVFGSHYPYFGA